MEDRCREATESIDHPAVASSYEEETIHSALADTVESHELSDVISSGSSFEILSMKEGIGEAQESIDESIGATSILESCSVHDTNSDESYRAERTKKYVMESEYEFVDDGETTDSDPFVKVSKVDEENVDSGQLPFTGPKCGKTEILMDIQPEREIECDTTERLKVTESSSSEDSIEQQQDHQISEQDNNHQNSDRNLAKQTKEADRLKQRDQLRRRLCLLLYFYLLSGIVVILALSINGGELPRKKFDCTFEDIDENFNFLQKNEFSFPSCLKHHVKADDIYQLAATVHVHQMTNAILRNSSLSYEVSKLSEANQALEEALADLTARFSEQLVKTRELEGRIMDLMRQPEHLESTAKRRVTKEDMASYDDEWELLTSKNRKESSGVSDVHFHLMKMIGDFRNITLELEQGSRDRTTDVQRQPVVFQTFLQSFVEANANVSEKSLTDQLDVLETSVFAIGKCLDRLQVLIPSKTIHDIFSLDWHQVQEIVSYEKEDATSEKGNKLSLEPCRVFMSKVAKNSSAGPFTHGKKGLKKYINKTLDAVNKIGQTVRSTLEAIKTLPDKFFSNGDFFKSFGHKFKTTVEGMNKRFYKGYNKLKDKVNRKFKTSLSELSKSVRAGWDKINKRSIPVDSLFSAAKNRFWKRGAKQTEKSNEQKSNEPAEEFTVEDTGKVQNQAKTRINPVEDLKSLEDGDMGLNELEFHSQSDVEEEASEDETLLQVPDVDSPLDVSNWLKEHQLRKEMSAIKSKSMAPMVEVSFDILKLTSGDFYLLDDLERTSFLKRLSLASAEGSDISAWTENWLYCQQGWWQEMTFGNSVHLEELVAACGPWLLKWQIEVQDGNTKRKQSTRYCEDGPLSDSPDYRATMNGHCKKDSDKRDSNWYFELMEDRENSRHVSEWYFGRKRSVSKQHQKPVRKGYRGR